MAENAKDTVDAAKQTGDAPPSGCISCQAAKNSTGNDSTQPDKNNSDAGKSASTDCGPNIKVTIKFPGNGQYNITGAPAMPSIQFTATVEGVNDTPQCKPTSYKWKVSIQHDASKCPHGPSRKIPAGQPYAVTETVTSANTWTPTFQSIRGGDMTVEVEVVINNATYKDKKDGLTITGTNPVEASVKAEPGMHNVLSRMMRQESSFKQFNGNCPYWSGDGKGGVGFLQITNPAPSDDAVWNWKTNVADGISLFKKKLAVSQGQNNRVQSFLNTTAWKKRVEDYNKFVRGVGTDPTKKAIAISVSDWDETDWNVATDKLGKVNLDAIRGFNGYGNKTDKITGSTLREFRLALDTVNGHEVLRVTNINEQTLTGEAVWEQVPSSDRGSQGDPNYVANVLAKAP